MAKQTADEGAQNPIIPGDKRQLQRRPDESESAHQARLAYCHLDPDKRTIAAAYRTIKGLPLDSDTKTPGYFGAWAKQHHWKAYAAAYDAYHQGLTALPENDQLTNARRQIIKKAEQLQELIQKEIDRLKETGGGRRLWPGKGNADHTADLANLAAAFKDTSAAQLAALREPDPPID